MSESLNELQKGARTSLPGAGASERDLEVAIGHVLLGQRPLAEIAREVNLTVAELVRLAARYSEAGQKALAGLVPQAPAAEAASPAPEPAKKATFSFAEREEAEPQRTLVLSDLHLGNGGPYDIFAGGGELARLLDAECSQQPTRVILNGDTVDFLLNTDPLQLQIPRAIEQARAIAAHADSAASLQALGRVLAQGGEVIVRMGNHDAELALGEVQAVFRGALKQPAQVAARLRFHRGEDPAKHGGILDINGARILITHGEQDDVWNKLPYDTLPGPDGPDVSVSEFEYPPGSMLVKTLLNPLKGKYNMRFADLLKPDFRGAVLTALAVNPGSVRSIFQGSTAELLWLLFRKKFARATFAEPRGADLGLSQLVQDADLSPGELGAVMRSLGGAAGPASFAASDEEGALDSALVKLGQAGLSAYARVQRGLAGQQGQEFFAYSPDEQEWAEARRLAKKYKVSAVIFGHSHAARFRDDGDLVYVNTGTWIWLMQLPAADAPVETWAEYLSQLRRNPKLDPAAGPAPKLLRRLNGALIEPHPAGGARLSLVEWEPARGLVPVKESRVPAGPA
jgi:predicted phosphodiesterase